MCGLASAGFGGIDRLCLRSLTCRPEYCCGCPGSCRLTKGCLSLSFASLLSVALERESLTRPRCFGLCAAHLLQSPQCWLSPNPARLSALLVCKRWPPTKRVAAGCDEPVNGRRTGQTIEMAMSRQVYWRTTFRPDLCPVLLLLPSPPSLSHPPRPGMGPRALCVRCLPWRPTVCSGTDWVTMA